MVRQRDEEFDVIVLGSGIAGLATALAAQRQGLKTLLLENQPKLGGGTTHSWGLIWVGTNHLAKAEGVVDPREEVLEYMRFLSGGQAVAENMERFIDAAPGALKFFERCGIRFRLVKGVADHYWGMTPSARDGGRSLEAELISGHVLGKWRSKLLRPHVAPSCISAEELVKWGGFSNLSHWDARTIAERKAQDMQGLGLGLVTSFLEQVLKAGVDVRTRQRTTELLVSDGNVTGVMLSTGRAIRARKGVVLATGGYEANPEMVSNLEGLPGWHSIFPQVVKGDGLVLGSSVGGALHVIQNSLQMMLGFQVPVEGDWKKYEFWPCGIIEQFCPHTLVVNRAGKRFADETYFQHMAPKFREFDVAQHRHVNLPCYFLFDQNFANRFSFAGQPLGTPIPDWVQRADTPAGLATKLGVDPAGLVQTFARFNADVAMGRDSEFHRGEAKWSLSHDKGNAQPQRLGALDKGPFYGIEAKPAAGSAAGLLTNRNAQVLRYDRKPIAGLYAMGNTAARIEFGVGYQAGYTLASGITFGLVSARHMKRRRI